MRNEQGRSLTEMLGTLAIIGVLSVVGMWMYGVAMDKLRANEIINEAQKRAVVVAGQIGLMGRKDPTLVEFTDNAFAGGTFATEVTTERLYQQFGIKVSGVNKRICQNIVNGIGNSSPIRRVAHATDPTNKLESCADDNTFLMIYNNDLSGAENDTKYCEDSQCQTVCGHNCIMKDDAPTCQDECPTDEKTCTQNSDCTGECVGCVIPEGETTGTCQACQRVAYLESTGTQYINSDIYISGSHIFKAEYVMTFTNPTYRQLHGYTAAGWGYWGIAASGYYESSGSIFPSEKDSIIWEKGFEDDDAYVYLSINGVRRRKAKLFGYEYGKLTLFALGTNVSFGMEAKMYLMKLYHNGTLVRDFIPVHAAFQPAGKQNCMFDKVSKELFCNEANGTDFKTNLSE